MKQSSNKYKTGIRNIFRKGNFITDDFQERIVRGRVSGEITGNKNREVYYQINDSIFSTHVDTRQTKLVYVFPTDFKGNITTINADETLLGGVWSTDAEKNKFEPNVHFSPDGKWVIFRANFEGRMKFML